MDPTSFFLLSLRPYLTESQCSSFTISYSPEFLKTQTQTQSTNNIIKRGEAIIKMIKKKIKLKNYASIFFQFHLLFFTFLLYSIKFNLKRENYSPYNFVPKIYTSSTTMKIHRSIILRTEPEWHRTTMRTIHIGKVVWK